MVRKLWIWILRLFPGFQSPRSWSAPFCTGFYTYCSPLQQCSILIAWGPRLGALNFNSKSKNQPQPAGIIIIFVFTYGCLEGRICPTLNSPIRQKSQNWSHWLTKVERMKKVSLLKKTWNDFYMILKLNK